MHEIQSGLAGTKTEKNLYDAATGESKASTKYKIFSGVANEEGYQVIGDVFDTISGQEREHAEVWLRYLGEIGDTKTNLEYAVAGEEYESTNMYPAFAKTAKEEGFDEISNKFRMVGEIEGTHNNIYSDYLNQMETGTLFTGSADTVWVCTNCGYRHQGRTAPERCPVCSYPQGYFARLPEENE